MDQLLFLLIVAAIGFINWKLKQKQEEDATTQAPPPAPPATGRPPRKAPATDGESEQERMRRFLEALGIPSEVLPPPPATAPPPLPQPAPTPAEATSPKVPRQQQRSAPPVRHKKPPPVPVARPPKSEPIESQDAGSVVFETLVGGGAGGGGPVPVEKPVAAVQPVAGVAMPVVHTTATPPPRQPMRQWLATGEDVRRAVILREILGPPRGLAPYAGGPA